MHSYKDGEYEIRQCDPQADIAVYKALGVIPTAVDVSFSRWKDDDLYGAVMYQRFTHTAICVHVIGFMDNWISRDFIWLSFHYPFVQLHCERIFSLVHSGNQEAIRFNLKMGFKIETRIRNVYPDGDQIVLVMERADCRWLKLKPRGIKSNRD